MMLGNATVPEYKRDSLVFFTKIKGCKLPPIHNRMKRDSNRVPVCRWETSRHNEFQTQKFEIKSIKTDHVILFLF